MNHIAFLRVISGLAFFALFLATIHPAFADDAPAAKHDWTWVKGAVFVPTNCVNEAQQWDEYDPAINDRELHYASIYGINCVRVYLHYYVFLKKPAALLNDIEDFLTRADKYGIKTEFVFFDDCWNNPSKAMLASDYVYPKPVYGVHNSQWLKSPGMEVLKNYAENLPQLKAYVQTIVNAHKSDKRIAFWETYNEPNASPETHKLLQDSQQWIHETGTTLPLTATGKGFAGDAFSDFATWHLYSNYALKGGPTDLCTECMNREGQSVPGIVEQFAGKSGFIIWELGIGRDNCRFAWGQNRGSPAKEERAAPFHGMIYPDGHPWSLDDVKARMGADAFAKAKLFHVEYFKDDHFGELAKTSVTPMIDFDLGEERGTGSPDSSAQIPQDRFSVRWKGSILAPASGRFPMSIDGDGIVKITVAGKTIIDKKDAGRGEANAEVELAAGKPAEIQVEYVHSQGGASLHLTWDQPGLPKKALLPG